ncbi:MAG: hypothetical protein R3E77_04300 [Steroidobacteraceae bacterium]
MHALWVAHIVILGYWLGAELVINSTYRHFSFSGQSPMVERTRQLAHVMDVDQHVRYALLLQLGTGVVLAIGYGYLPGQAPAIWLTSILVVAWLALVELVHHRRLTKAGERLARFDRGLRYLAVVLLLIGATMAHGVLAATPGWLRLKLALFASIIACGVGIRLSLLPLFTLWKGLDGRTPDPSEEQAIHRIYWRSTAILLLLWLLIAGAVTLSVIKPRF